jgi:hypothetical protein
MRLRRRSLAALAGLAGLLFLQVAIAFAPCQLPGRSAATALAAAMASMPDCHEADEANLCLAHCASEDQTLGNLQLELPDLAVPAAVPIRFVVPPGIPAGKRPPPLAAAGPPSRILFQSFRL